MKKIILIFAGMLFISVAAVQAQSADTLGRPKRDTTRIGQAAPQGSVTLKDMTVLRANEVPASLRTTLQGSEYTGWDASTSKVYRNKTSDLYVVQIQDGTMTKTYRFDRNGKPIKDN